MLFFWTILLGLCGGLESSQYYKIIYKDTASRSECSKLLGHARHQRVDAPTLPDISGEWTSSRCEIRPGPEFLLRKYLFRNNTNFELHQYYYSDPECHFPIYSVISEGTYHLAMNSWVVSGGTIAFYELMRMQVIPYTQNVASRMKRLLQNSCPEVTSFNTSWKWQPYQKYEIVHKNNYYDEDVGYDHMSYDEDCSEIFNVTLSELQLLRMEIRHHNLHPIHGTGTSKELLLGDIDTNLPTRHHHKPSSYQTPLKFAKDLDCAVCHRISASNDMNPPILKDKFGTIMDLVGDWVSARCETRPNGMFLTRYLTFGDDKRTWQGHYAFYRDPYCHLPTFALNAKGLYVDRRKSSQIQGAVEYDFKVTSVKITPKDVTTVEFLNASIGCGKFGSWRRNVEQDVTSTNGCHSLDIKLPETEYELMKMDMSHGKLHLFVGQRPSDGASLRTVKRRPTSFQEPIVKCDTIAVFMSLNNINEPQKLVGGISGQCRHIGSAIIAVVSFLHMLLFM